MFFSSKLIHYSVTKYPFIFWLKFINLHAESSSLTTTPFFTFFFVSTVCTPYLISSSSMGACNSHSSIALENSQLNHSASPLVTVISISGELCHYAVPITAGQVHSSESFVCNSDALVHGEFILELKSEEELLPDNLYFILPKIKLNHRLNASDMAALAVRASFALQIRISCTAVPQPTADEEQQLPDISGSACSQQQ